MKPLTELKIDPRFARDRVDIIAFDIDDTVTERGQLQPEAFQAMWDLRRAGFRLIAATGRPLGWADVVARHWPVEFVVGENGAGYAASTSGAPLRKGYLDTEEERMAFRDAAGKLVTAVRQAFPEVRLADDQDARRCDLAFDIGEHVSIDHSQREALVAFLKAQGLSTLTSSVHCHALFGDWDKVKGIALGLSEVMGLDIATSLDRIVYIGDSPNDEPAFSFFPLSVGVANLAERAERFATLPAFITRAPRGAGFAELASLLLSA